jgi:hypothetical protein
VAGLPRPAKLGIEGDLGTAARRGPSQRVLQRQAVVIALEETLVQPPPAARTAGPGPLRPPPVTDPVQELVGVGVQVGAWQQLQQLPASLDPLLRRRQRPWGACCVVPTRAC